MSLFFLVLLFGVLVPFVAVGGTVRTLAVVARVAKEEEAEEELLWCNSVSKLLWLGEWLGDSLEVE